MTNSMRPLTIGAPILPYSHSKTSPREAVDSLSMMLALEVERLEISEGMLQLIFELEDKAIWVADGKSEKFAFSRIEKITIEIFAMLNRCIPKDILGKIRREECMRILALQRKNGTLPDVQSIAG